MSYSTWAVERLQVHRYDGTIFPVPTQYEDIFIYGKRRSTYQLGAPEPSAHALARNLMTKVGGDTLERCNQTEGRGGGMLIGRG